MSEALRRIGTLVRTAGSDGATANAGRAVATAREATSAVDLQLVEIVARHPVAEPGPASRRTPERAA